MADNRVSYDPHHLLRLSRVVQVPPLDFLLEFSDLHPEPGVALKVSL